MRSETFGLVLSLYFEKVYTTMARKRDWILVLTTCGLWAQGIVEFGTSGSVSLFGLADIPFALKSDAWPFLRILWLIVLCALLISFISSESKSVGERCSQVLIWLGSIVTLGWFYDDVVSSTVFSRVSLVQVSIYSLLGGVVGVCIGAFADFAMQIRSAKSAKKLGLPRIPDIAFRGMKGTAMVALIIICMVVASLVYWSESLSWKCIISIVVLAALVLVAKCHYPEDGKVLVKPNDQLKVFLNAMDRRLQMNEILKKINLPVLPQKFKNPHARQAAVAQATMGSRDYIVSWTFLGEFVEKGVKVLRFTWVEDGQVKFHNIPKNIVAPYEEALSTVQVSHEKRSTSQVIEVAASYALVNLVLRAGGVSLLYACVQASRTEDLEAIIIAESDVNRVYAAMGGWTVLMLAVAQGFVEGVQLLLKYAADPNVRNAMGVTPLLFAVRYDNLPCVKLLCEAGADMRVCDSQGANVMVVAAKHGASSVVPYLISQGVDVRRKDFHGHTALEYAQNLKYGEIANCIRKKLAVG